MKDNKKYRLVNGVEIPCIGFGTDRTFIFLKKNIFKGVYGFVKDIVCDQRYYWKRDRSIFNIVKNAPLNGCYLYDTASCYGQSERILGYALRHFNRDEYFIITKLSNVEQRSGDVEKALIKSIKRLNVEYVDLYLMHWPHTNTYLDCWKQMEILYKKGYAKAIGVCNFKQQHFEELFKVAKIAPMVCQIESHPLFNQNSMLQYCKDNNIQMMAYTPTGRMDKRLRENTVLRQLSDKYSKSIAQIILRWHYQRGVIPIVNTTKIEHLKDNMDIFDFQLLNCEMELINGINIDCRLRYDPDTVDYTKC